MPGYERQNMARGAEVVTAGDPSPLKPGVWGSPTSIANGAPECVGSWLPHKGLRLLPSWCQAALSRFD